MTIHKCFTKHTLAQANRIAIERNYNRKIPMELIDALPDDSWFPIYSARVHEHVVGVKVDPHMRCFVALEKDNAGFIDVDLDLFNSLMSVDIPDDEAEAINN